MPRFAILLALLASLTAAEPALSGTWVGSKVEPAAGAMLVLAMYDRDGTCCGGPAAALAGLANLRTALKDVAQVQLIAIDVTAGATTEQASAAAVQYRTDGLPLLVDNTRKTALALGLELDMTMTYVIRKADGTQEVVHSPNQVKKALGL